MLWYMQDRKDELECMSIKALQQIAKAKVFNTCNFNTDCTIRAYALR